MAKQARDLVPGDTIQTERGERIVKRVVIKLVVVYTNGELSFCKPEKKIDDAYAIPVH
jgi:hypothetical protein